MNDKKASAENMAARIVNSLEGLERLIKQRTEIDFYIQQEKDHLRKVFEKEILARDQETEGG